MTGCRFKKVKVHLVRVAGMDPCLAKRGQVDPPSDFGISGVTRRNEEERAFRMDQPDLSENDP